MTPQQEYDIDQFVRRSAAKALNELGDYCNQELDDNKVGTWYVATALYCAFMIHGLSGSADNMDYFTLRNKLLDVFYSEMDRMHQEENNAV